MLFLNDLASKCNNFLWTYILIALLLCLGLFFSYKTKFVQFRMIKEMFRLLGDGLSSNKDKKGISSFQAFCISTASRVGTGNLAGIAIAITVGGPGAIFWMWVIALIGASSSFVESTLAQLYKEKDSNGDYIGGPAFYMKKALNKKWMGFIFAILISITFGLIFNSVQSNTITSAVNTAFGFNKNLIGIMITILTFIIIFGGIHRIAKISEVIVPIMAIAYILIALLVILLNITKLPSVIALIVSNAFGIKQVAGGTIGAALLNGIRRGLFSNEAGMGSAPNAAATATVSHPVKQGLIQTLGVFTDTIIICSCTAFIILLSDIDPVTSGLKGIELTQRALSSQIGPFGNYFIAICILLFSFSSIIGNYYYGESNIDFISNKKYALTIYRLFTVAMVFIGSMVSLDFVWTLADIFMGLMAIINLIAIAMLCKTSFRLLKDYEDQKRSGIKEPVFTAKSMPDLTNIDAWK